MLIYGIVKDEYSATQKVFGSFEVIFGFILVVQLIKTRSRRTESKNRFKSNSILIGIENDIEKRDSFLKNKSILEHYEDNKHKEPKINIRIKPRTKDHPSDDFKVVVWYQIEHSKNLQ